MPTLVVRPLTAALRCAACHDDLTERRVTCPACRAVLHRDCRADLARCPTYGCSAVTVTDRPARRASAFDARARRGRGPAFHMAWLVPGLLSFLWPVLFALSEFSNPAALALGLLAGPVVGHGVFAPWSRAQGDPGSPQARALIAEAIGFGASIPAILVWLVVVVSRGFA